MTSDSDDESHSDDTASVNPDLSRVISKETAERAVNLTEYFQDQRKIYEDVSSIWNIESWALIIIVTFIPSILYRELNHI